MTFGSPHERVLMSIHRFITGLLLGLVFVAVVLALAT
jgi:hypothetical protein